MRRLYRTSEVLPLLPIPSGYRFQYVNDILSALRWFWVVSRSKGFGPALRTFAKSSTPSRAYYFVSDVSGKIVSDGWVMFGRCVAYRIAENDHVIGPIFTDPKERGKGLASSALTFAVKHSKDLGADLIYIDTTSENIASQSAILKAGFKFVS